MPLAVGGADLADGVQCFAERLLEQFKRAVFMPLQFFHALAELNGDPDDERIHKNDKQRQRPMHDKQHHRGARDHQRRDNKLRHRLADKVVDAAHVGDEMRGHRPAAHCFVFGHRNRLQMAQHTFPQAISDLFGDTGELPRLPHPGRERAEA